MSRLYLFSSLPKPGSPPHEEVRNDEVIDLSEKRFGLCENYIIFPPDGGRVAWLCVAIAMYGHFVTDGLVLTFIINRKRNREMKGQTTFLVGSAALALISILSPLSSALLNQFGFRTTLVTGSVITSGALIGCHYVDNVYVVSILYIIGGGIGCSLIKISCELLPSYFFCRKRVIVSSISAFGSAFGLMILPTSSIIVQKESFEFLFAGAIFLPLLFLGLFIKPLKGINVKVLPKIDRKIKFSDFALAEVKAEKGPSGRLVCGTFVNNAYPRVLDVIGFHKGRIVLPDENYLKASFRGSKSSRKMWGSTEFELEVDSTAKSQGARPLYRTDMFYHGFVGHLHEYVIQRPTITSACTCSNSPVSYALAARISYLFKHFPSADLLRHLYLDSYFDYQLFVSRAPSRKDLDEEARGKMFCPESFKRVLATMLDFKLMSNTPYCMVMGCLCFSFVGSHVPYFYLEARTLFLGFSEKNATGLLFYFGVGYLFAKVLSATLMTLDRSIRIEWFIFVGLLARGSISILTNLGVFQKLYYFTCYALVLGTVAGLMPTSRLLFLYELLTLDNLTTAIGIMYIFQGALAFCGLATASCLNQIFDVNMVYLYAGGCDIFAASMIIPLRFLHERLRNKLTVFV